MIEVWTLPNFICPKCFIDMIQAEAGPNARITIFCDTPDCPEFGIRYVVHLETQEVFLESP